MNLKTAVQIAYYFMEAKPPLSEIAQLYVHEEQFNYSELGGEGEYCARCRMPVENHRENLDHSEKAIAMEARSAARARLRAALSNQFGGERIR